MKKVAILCLAVSLLSSGCGTTQPERTGAIVGGAAIGNSVGGAIGGLVGDSPSWLERKLQGFCHWKHCRHTGRSCHWGCTDSPKIA